ncbi:MAG: hypothetical protein ACK56F_25915, partial [bacterium]
RSDQGPSTGWRQAPEDLCSPGDDGCPVGPGPLESFDGECAPDPCPRARRRGAAAEWAPRTTP